MKTLSLSEAKIQLSKLVESVSGVDEEIVITKNGRPAAVLVSPDEFESWRETTIVRFDKELMQEIRGGLTELKDGPVSLYSLENLFQDPLGE